MKRLLGISYMELLFVIAIFALLGAMSTPFLSSFVLQSNLSTTKDKMVSTIRKAQMYSVNNKNGETWGVCITDGKLRLYSSSCGSPLVSEDFDIPSTIIISGLVDTSFSPGRGEPSNSLDIVVSSNVGSVEVMVNKAGGMTFGE